MYLIEIAQYSFASRNIQNSGSLSLIFLDSNFIMKTKQEIDGPNVTIFIKLQVSYKKLHYLLHSVLIFLWSLAPNHILLVCAIRITFRKIFSDGS